MNGTRVNDFVIRDISRRREGISELGSNDSRVERVKETKTPRVAQQFKNEFKIK